MSPRTSLLCTLRHLWRILTRSLNWLVQAHTACDALKDLLDMLCTFPL